MPHSATLWNLTSRVHKLHCFPKHNVCCYVKRDDELSCAISGTKLRKYASIVPFLQAKQINHLIIIAGPQSNNLLAALQIARELQLKITAFLLKPKSPIIQGNFKLSLLFLDEQEIIWVERADWAIVEHTAQTYLYQSNDKGFILNEGSSVPQALQGAMSLADDIHRNEQQLGITFQHIFIDAGTGFSAAALINRLHSINHPAIVHVLLLADSEELFKQKLEQWLGFMSQNYQCFYPQTARSFGSVNQEIKKEIKKVAREEGILLEPIYSGKLFYAARRYISEHHLTGNVLIIHSGGLLTLSGFN